MPGSFCATETPGTSRLGTVREADRKGAIMKVLVTGGAGYIGSTTARALEKAGHTPVILTRW